jgi:hypothetical protein
MSFPRYRVNLRPCGDFAVQRFINGRIQRWGVYAFRETAVAQARLANAASAIEEKEAAR